MPSFSLFKIPWEIFTPAAKNYMVREKVIAEGVLKQIGIDLYKSYYTERKKKRNTTFGIEFQNKH